NIPVSIRGYTSRRSGHQSLKDRGSFLDADIPEMGVTFASRNTKLTVVYNQMLGKPATEGAIPMRRAQVAAGLSSEFERRRSFPGLAAQRPKETNTSDPVAAGAGGP
ncbi:hypothetical protein ACO2Q0_17690, partial [Phenylobacterium sp. VNQ135]|uniref:hypothetical protein n=1 Tax=Phenylobacterium sp. VNQ135 TaxID=3400922 RepID=UPI003C0E0A3B